MCVIETTKYNIEICDSKRVRVFSREDKTKDYTFHTYDGIVTGRQISSLENYRESVPREVISALREAGYHVREGSFTIS